MPVGQVATLRRAFLATQRAEVVQEIEFSTVDGVQGREFDVVIMSCVRASQV